MAALVWFTCRQDVMGSYKNRTLIKTTAIVAACAVLSLNVILLLQAFGVEIPGLPSV
jgi:manganese transport protein